MTLKEIANAFDMTVDNFAKHTGYTRQALYGNRLSRNTARAKAAISSLRFLNYSMLQKEMETAKRRFEARKNAVEELGRLLLEDCERKADNEISATPL